MGRVHVKKGDEVYILSGRDRTKTGKVLEVHTKTNRVTVDGINIVKKHQKPRPPAEPEGGIKEKPAPIHASNVKLLEGKKRSRKLRLLRRRLRRSLIKSPLRKRKPKAKSSSLSGPRQTIINQEVGERHVRAWRNTALR